MSTAIHTPGVIQPQLHLTARGRTVLTVLAATPLVIAALIAGISSGSASASLETGSTDFTYVTVAAGESLWDVAETVAPNADPRDVVADIVALNALGSADVTAGERIAIPTAYEPAH